MSHNTNPVLYWTDHAGERQAMPLADVKREFEQFLQWRAQQAQPAASGEPVAWRGAPNSPSDPEICNERSAQVSGPVYCGDSGAYCSACPKRVAAPAPFPACKGMNCGATDGRSHSLECHAEHAAAIAGGEFVPATAQPAPALVALTDAQITKLSMDCYDGSTNPLILFARAVEAAHGIVAPDVQKGPAK